MMPGFTADAALSELRGCYRLRAEWENSLPAQIIAQRIKLRDWTCDCDARTDICVCESGGIVRVIHAVLGEL
jgi:hypothetical protein